MLEKILKLLLILVFLALIGIIIHAALLRKGYCMDEDIVPQNYWIEKHKLTNEYRWCAPSGYCNDATFQTKHKAIKDAWKFYNFKKWQADKEKREREDNKNWQKVRREK